MAIVMIRTAIIYAALLLAMRLMGKRQLGEMELSEFVVASLIADLAAHPLQDVGIPMTNGLVPILTLFCFEILIAGASMKSIRLRTMLFGGPSVLVRRGVIDQREMRRNRFTADELMQELRKQGLFDLSQVEYGILETDGGCPLIVISEGRTIEKNLRALGRDAAWLKEELREKGHEDPKTVYLMTVNQKGQSYIAAKEAAT